MFKKAWIIVICLINLSMSSLSLFCTSFDEYVQLIALDSIGVLAVKHDGKVRIVDTSTLEQRCGLWDSVRSTPSQAMHVLTESAVGMISLGDHCIITTSKHTTNITVWDAQSGACIQELKGHLGEISALGAAADGSRIVSGAIDGEIRVWDAVTGSCLQVLLHARAIKALHVIDGDEKVVSGDGAGLIKVWNLTDGSCLHTLEGHNRIIGCFTTRGEGDETRLLSGAFDCTVRLWNLQTGACESSFANPGYDPIISLSMLDDSTVMVTDRKARSFILDTRTGIFKMVQVDLQVLLPLKDRPWLFTVYGNCSVELIDKISCKCIRRLAKTDERLWDLVALSDGRKVAGVTSRGHLLVWELDKGDL